jgi:hypothetical protein
LYVGFWKTLPKAVSNYGEEKRQQNKGFDAKFETIAFDCLEDKGQNRAVLAPCFGLGFGGD